MIVSACSCPIAVVVVVVLVVPLLPLVDRCANAKDQISVEVGADLEIATRLAKMMENHPHLFKKQPAVLDGKPRDGQDPAANDGTDNPSDAKGKGKNKAKGKSKAKAKAKAGMCRISV